MSFEPDKVGQGRWRGRIWTGASNLVFFRPFPVQVAPHTWGWTTPEKATEGEKFRGVRRFTPRTCVPSKRLKKAARAARMSLREFARATATLDVCNGAAREWLKSKGLV